MKNESNAEFALRVSDQILTQIEGDHAINKQNIAFIIEREVAARPAPNASEVAKRAKELQNALINMSGVNWPSDATNAYRALSEALREERGVL